MKNVKRIVLSAVLTVIFLFALAPTWASADSSSANHNYYFYQPDHGGYSLISNQSNSGVVRFLGTYFGNSKISVTVDMYTSNGFTIDFFVNQPDSELTPSQIANRNKLRQVAEQIHNLIVSVDNLANTQYDGTVGNPVSEVYKYNQAKCGDRLEISKETYEMLQIAKEMYRETDGAFNPAVYRLVDLWGFSSRIYSNGDFGLTYDREVSAEHFFNDGYPLPADKFVKAFSDKSFIDFSDNAVILSEESGKYYVTKNVGQAVVDGEEFTQWIDLGGIAKGYVVDCIKQILIDSGITEYSLNAGGSSAAVSADNYVSVIDPDSPFIDFGETTDVLGFNNADAVLISTSGQYIRKYTTNGVEYSHIIDGAKGAPAQTGITSVTIVAPEGSFWAGKGDCLTTALTVMGRDKLVEFMNGYLQDNGIKVVALYETADGSRQILANIAQSDVADKGENFSKYSWSVKSENGIFVYDATAKPPIRVSGYTVVIIVLGVLAALSVAGVVIYYFVKGRKKTLGKIQTARKDKPFKPADVGVYLFVALFILILFAVFFSGEQDASIKYVEVIDMQTEETLFLYNVARGEWIIYDDAINGWKVDADSSNGVTVTFTRVIDGEERFNKLHITTDGGVSVKMTESVCGFSQDCVRNFPAVTRNNGTIVCSPNMLKVITR